MDRQRDRRAAGAIIGALVLLLIAGGRSAASKTDAPTQPIDFSHLVHASDDKLSCDFCHATARRSPFAGIAPVERCMGCHRVVNVENPEIGKVRAYWQAGETIPWQRVYVLPRFVHFSHEAHYRGGVACRECHGDVARMQHVAVVTDLSMGWCIECHRQRQASDDCLTCHY